MITNKRGLDLIRGFEKCKLESYLCPAGVWTIGWGHTGNVQPGQKITQAQADILFINDVERFEREVLSLLEVPVTVNQFSALVSFAYNTGSDIDKDDIAEGLGDSTLLKKLNAGDYEGAAGEFKKWVYCKGKKLPGLIARREAERELFQTPDIAQG